MVFSVTLCYSECRDTNKLEAAHHRWQRKILKISWKDMITNKTVRKHRTRHFGVNYKRRQLRWFGDTYRMDSNRIAQVRDWTLPHFRRERTSKSVMDFNSEKKIWICWVWHGMKLWI